MSNESPDYLEERIAAYIDGQLPPAEAARLEVYLANTDAKLAETVINMIGDRHRLKSLPKESAPDDLAARIMEQVERTSLLHNVDWLAPPRRPWWQTRAAAAALLLVVLAGFTLYMHHALQPTNPQWQAALDTAPRLHLPIIAAGPAAAPMPPATAPSRSNLAEMAQLDLLKTRKLDEKLTTAASTAAEPASANATLALAGTAESERVRAHTEPVTLAFVARDSTDFVRLQTIIDAANSPAADAGLASPSPSMEDQVARQNAPGGGGGVGGATASNAGNANAPTPTPEQLHQYQNQSQNQLNANRNDLYRNQADFGMADADRAAQKDQSAAVTAAPATPPPTTLQYTAQLPVTYHVSLRPSDIAALSRQFQHATEDAVARRDKTAATLPALADAPHPAAADGTRIDCIITMSPPPPPPPPTSQPTTSPAQ